jgi:hypothetical protein
LTERPFSYFAFAIRLPKAERLLRVPSSLTAARALSIMARGPAGPPANGGRHDRAGIAEGSAVQAGGCAAALSANMLTPPIGGVWIGGTGDVCVAMASQSAPALVTFLNSVFSLRNMGQNSVFSLRNMGQRQTLL